MQCGSEDYFSEQFSTYFYALVCILFRKKNTTMLAYVTCRTRKSGKKNVIINVWSLFIVVGLTPDENHISPIENLDNTISRLYSYLSGSEGEGETEGVSPHHRARRGHHPQQHRHRRHHPHHHGGEKWERRRSRTPPSDDSSQSSYSQSDSELVNHRDINMDTLRSSGTGENVYSRINDTGKVRLNDLVCINYTNGNKWAWIWKCMNIELSVLH